MSNHINYCTYNTNSDSFDKNWFIFLDRFLKKFERNKIRIITRIWLGYFFLTTWIVRIYFIFDNW